MTMESVLAIGTAQVTDLAQALALLKNTDLAIKTVTALVQALALKTNLALEMATATVTIKNMTMVLDAAMILVLAQFLRLRAGVAKRRNTRMKITFNSYITVKNVQPDRILETYNRLAEVVRSDEFAAFLKSKSVDLVSVGITGDYDVEGENEI